MFSETYPVKILHTVRPSRPAWPRLVLALWVQALVLPGETRFHHVHLNAADPAAATEFFAKRFPSDAIRVAKREEVKPGPTALWHLGWGAADFRAGYVRLLDLGTRFSHPAEQLLPGLFYAYAVGPEGLSVELNSSKRDGFGHIHLYSAHPVVAGEWYQRLGLQPTRPLEEKPVVLGRYTLSSAAYLDAGGVALLIFPKPDDVGDLVSSEGTVVDHLAFQVDDLDRKLSDLRRSGTRILQMPSELSPGTRAAVVQGPDRMRVELVEVK